VAFSNSKTVVVCGATGRQGGAVARHLLEDGWRVRAMTRTPEGPKARSLPDLGAEVVRADMDDPRSLEAAFEGAYGVYSVQNPVTSGLEREVAQGKNVASVAKSAGVRHLVYGSAGLGSPTGIGSWDSKLVVEEHMRELDLPVTILRPMAFMELMTDKSFYPPVSTWHVMPKLAGPKTKIVWLAVDDLGVIAAKAFADPDRFVGQALLLAADAQSIGECRAIWKEVRGRRPRRFPMPVAMFERVAGTDLTTMWRWVRGGPVPLDTGPTREIHPGALTVREWLRQRGDEGRNDGR
jgi:uncharacterized protein YbjT (DUF2867 family)